MHAIRYAPPFAPPFADHVIVLLVVMTTRVYNYK